jgi:uncharacterized protein
MRFRPIFGSILFAIALYGFDFLGVARAASFSCAEASGCIETVICETPQLSSLDSRMASLYEELQDAATRRGARRLLDSQRDWLDRRDSCGCNANCLVSKYESRIRLFKDVLDED